MIGEYFFVLMRHMTRIGRKVAGALRSTNIKPTCMSYSRVHCISLPLYSTYTKSPMNISVV